MKTKRAGLELKGVTSNFRAGESVCTMYERNEEPSTLTTVNHQELRRRSVARPTCFNANRRHFAQPYTLVLGGEITSEGGEVIYLPASRRDQWGTIYRPFG